MIALLPACAQPAAPAPAAPHGEAAATAAPPASAKVATPAPEPATPEPPAIVAAEPAAPTPAPAPAPPPPRRLRAVDPPMAQPEVAGTVVAARIFAFSDSQFHYTFGKRTFAQSPFAESMSFEVAVRPAALDDGSDLLLSLFLADYRAHYANHTLVFLGDAADLSCTQELDAFVDVLAEANVTELLSVTSNHDGFYAGNFTSKNDLDGMLALTDMPDDWTRACSLPGEFADRRLTKGRAVKRWHGLLPAGERWGTEVSWLGDGPTEFRRSFLYHVRPLGGGEPGAPPVYGVFLDTVDYRGFDLESSRGAGSAGAISRDQLLFLDRAMFEASIDAGEKPATFVVFGHHPFRSLEPRSRDRLAAFFEAHPEIAAYVSAHAHESMERAIELRGGRALPEYIVGSTTDAPQAARTLEVRVSRDGARRAVTTQRLLLDTDTLCAGIAPMASDTLGYTGYRILRDGTPELDVGAIEKLMFAAGLDDLGSQRVVQGVGALLMENELVRSWARLYADAPIPRPLGAQRALEAILARRYAAGNDIASLRPYLRGEVSPGPETAYSAWHDPVLARVLGVAERGVHRFGANAAAFQSLRPLRSRDAEARRYFACHAAYAAQAEARLPRRHGNVLYIR